MDVGDDSNQSFLVKLRLRRGTDAEVQVEDRVADEVCSEEDQNDNKEANHLPPQSAETSRILAEQEQKLDEKEDVADEHDQVQSTLKPFK